MTTEWTYIAYDENGRPVAETLPPLNEMRYLSILENGLDEQTVSGWRGIDKIGRPFYQHANGLRITHIVYAHAPEHWPPTR